MSNLPPGVSNSTFGAPWNDEEFGGIIKIKVYVAGSVQGPNASEERIKEALADIANQLKGRLESVNAVCEVEITEKMIADV